MRLTSRVRIGVVINSAHHPPRYGQPISPDGKSVHTDDRFQIRNLAKLQIGRSLIKFRIFHFNHRQVAIVRHKDHPGRIFSGIRLPLYREVACSTHHMGIGHNPLSINDEARTSSGTDGPRIPREPIIPGLRSYLDHHHIFSGGRQLPIPFSATGQKGK